MSKKGLLRIVNEELRNRNLLNKQTDRDIILNLYRKFKNQNLSHDKTVRRMISEFKGFDEDYWKQKIERVLFSEGVIKNITIQEKDIKETLAVENLLSKDIEINQKKESIVGKIIKVNDKIGIILKVLEIK